MTINDEPTKRPWRWTRPRLARAAMLLGAGRDYLEIAGDAEVQSTPRAVRKILNACGVYARRRPARSLTVPVSLATLRALETHARRRHVAPEHLLSVVARILGDDAALLDNVVDDGR